MVRSRTNIAISLRPTKRCGQYYHRGMWNEEVTWVGNAAATNNTTCCGHIDQTLGQASSSCGMSSPLLQRFLIYVHREGAHQPIHADARVVITSAASPEDEAEHLRK